MKRYLVFGYDEFYPAGARQDQCGNVDTLDGVREIAKGRDGKPLCKYDFYDVLDLQERRWLDVSEWAGEK